VVALGWSHKYDELLIDFGLDRYAVGHDQLAEADLEATVAHAFGRRRELREQIRSRLPAVRAAVDETFDRTAAVIAGGAGLGILRQS
jgi:polysaccharide pyruvyl transferase WcaK-like protein